MGRKTTENLSQGGYRPNMYKVRWYLTTHTHTHTEVEQVLEERHPGGLLTGEPLLRPS